MHVTHTLQAITSNIITEMSLIIFQSDRKFNNDTIFHFYLGIVCANFQKFLKNCKQCREALPETIRAVKIIMSDKSYDLSVF